MSKLSQLLNERNREGWSALEVGRRAEANGYNLKPATVTGLFAGRHARHPKHQTLEALASVLPVTVEELRETLGLPPDPGEPWTPPDEARQLTTDQRAALGQLIKTIVTGGQHEDVARPGQKSAGGALTPQAQTTYGLAARRGKSHGRALRDQYDSLGEESQDDGE